MSKKFAVLFLIALTATFTIFAGAIPMEWMPGYDIDSNIKLFITHLPPQVEVPTVQYVENSCNVLGHEVLIKAGKTETIISFPAEIGDDFVESFAASEKEYYGGDIKGLSFSFDSGVATLSYPEISLEDASVLSNAIIRDIFGFVAAEYGLRSNSLQLVSIVPERVLPFTEEFEANGVKVSATVDKDKAVFTFPSAIEDAKVASFAAFESQRTDKPDYSSFTYAIKGNEATFTYPELSYAEARKIFEAFRDEFIAFRSQI